jgi:O-methyltransferase involved in polyketide biosynthesis
LFLKVLNFALVDEDKDFLKAISELITKRQAIFETYLNEKTFLEHDRKQWYKMAKWLSQKTGKPVIEYPFEQDLKDI